MWRGGHIKGSARKCSPCSVRRKAREIGCHDNVSAKSALLGSFPVIRFRQAAARNLPRALSRCPDRRDQMRKHAILCAYPTRPHNT